MILECPSRAVLYKKESVGGLYVEPVARYLNFSNAVFEFSTGSLFKGYLSTCYLNKPEITVAYKGIYYTAT
jgi:hypothetical protein